MRHLHREAELRHGGLGSQRNDALAGGAGKAHRQPEALEERQPEGEIFAKMQCARDTDERLAGRGLLLAILRQQQRFALGEEIANRDAAGAPFLELLAAPAVIERLLAAEAHAVDLAVVGARFALEGILLIGAAGEIPPFEAAGRLRVRGLARHQRAADGAGHFVMLRHGDRFAGDLAERPPPPRG